jgi:glycosyltransferase involved in cell wall biosynthesis
VSNKPIKVLHLLGSMDFGGVETWLMHLLRHIDRTKFQFDFCFTKPEPGAYVPEIDALGGRMVACRLERRNPLGFARKFRAILREGHYDVVHSHVHHFSGFVLRLARSESVPVRIAHCHSTSDGSAPSVRRVLYWALMKRWVAQSATHGLAASEPAAAALFGRDWKRDSRFRVLHCGIDLAPFRQSISRAEVRSELGIPMHAPVVGHVGRFMPPKNHAFLLEVAAQVIKLRPDVRFLLVGDGPLRLPMETKARELGIERRVIFAGERADVPRLMLGAMDVFLFPSLWEGLPLAVVEAQAAGLACIIADSVPAEAIVRSTQVSIVPLVRDPGYWAFRVSETLAEGRPKRSTTEDARFSSSFCIEASCRDLAELYASGEGR